MKHPLLLLLLSLIVFNCKEHVKSVHHVLKINGHLGQLEIKNSSDYTQAKDFVFGKYNYKDNRRFTKVKAIHASKVLFLDTVVYKAFIKMYNAAAEQGVTLKIISGTRNFNEQKAIWERKWEKYNTLRPMERAKKILEYSSMPTSSRHHWGTDLDLNSLSNSYFSSGKGQDIYNWLQTNANAYGFYQVYTEKTNGRTGYNLEKWHWSYLPLAHEYLNFYNFNIAAKDINGFKGAELANELNIIEDYVNGISKKAKDYK
ncbi:M15 family metallopeptidase [Winogradskyella eckloniae]|uniref:M15 family metallopeptidase n=1 Tax=Winogradskyella eckloniae TaxID=1089306 RepID=UPI001565CD3C|nr:M15 family metallopeptidase [Winogradskyella eckloniae]NRD21361.1 M15 family metallopeptidase [Winogradskyella eckloniae]